MKYVFMLSLLALSACSKESGPVSNAATQYVDGLQQGVQKAEVAADKANAAIAASAAEQAAAQAAAGQ